MSTWPEPASFSDPRQMIMKHCNVCQAETPHEIRVGEGVSAIICVPCLQHALSCNQTEVERV
jgi:hypothetical protein